jgi:hypothetical protein
MEGLSKVSVSRLSHSSCHLVDWVRLCPTYNLYDNMEYVDMCVNNSMDNNNMNNHGRCNIPTIIPSLIDDYVDIMCGYRQSDAICELYFNVLITKCDVGF